MKKLILVILMAFTLTACGVPQRDYDAVVAENTQLKTQVDKLEGELEDLKFGPERTLHDIKAEYENKNFEKVKQLVAGLIEKNPTAPETTEAKTILAKIESAEKAAKEADEKRLAAAVSYMTITSDEMTGITWYKDPSTTEYIDVNSFYAYVGKRDDSLVLRLKIQYQGDDWLFINSYTIKADDETFKLTMEYGDVQRDNGYGGVWEWIDIPATQDNIKMLKAIAKAKKTTVRHEGDTSYHDRVLTAKETQAISKVLDAYEALGGSVQ
ncbi:hypothetical protein D3C78_20310 [compost metagenome]